MGVVEVLELGQVSTGNAATLLAPLLIDKSSQARVAGTAYGKLCSIGEHRDVALLGERLDFGDALEIDDVGPVDAHESGGIESGFQARNCLLLQVLFAVGCQSHVIILSLGVIELGDGNDEYARAVADRDAVKILRWRTGGCGQVCRGRRSFRELAC